MFGVRIDGADSAAWTGISSLEGSNRSTFFGLNCWRRTRFFVLKMQNTAVA